MSKPVLYVMVGLAGSGKSSISRELAQKHHSMIVSSEAIRDEICEEGVKDQSKNAEVFQIFYSKIADYLKGGNNVIADATNININARRKLLSSVSKIECYKIAYIVPKPYELCLEDNIYKEVPVPHHLINLQMMNFQIPFKEEGFDEITIHQFENEYANDYFINDCFELMRKFEIRENNQVSNLVKHCENVCGQFLKMREYAWTEYPFAVRLHDIGKLFTEKINEEGIAQYGQHENVGCYYLLGNIENIRTYGCFSTEELLNILFLVNYHMLPSAWQSEKTKKKWLHIFGEYKYQMLCDFWRCNCENWCHK